RSDGTLVRDYFYVKDGVGAYMMTAEKLLAGEAGGEAFNFSNEIQVNVRQLVDIICRAAGVTHLEPVILNDAPNEIPHQYLSAEKARRQFGWKPAYTLEQGLAETLTWYRQVFAEAKANATAVATRANRT